MFRNLSSKAVGIFKGGRDQFGPFNLANLGWVKHFKIWKYGASATYSSLSAGSCNTQSILKCLTPCTSLRVLSPRTFYSLSGVPAIKVKHKYQAGMLKEINQTCKRLIMSSSKTPYHAGFHETEILNHESVEDVLQQYDYIFIDCDGVLWHPNGIDRFQHVGETVHHLRAKGKKLFFISNNSLYSSRIFLGKFEQLCGFRAEKSDVFGVAHATAVYLKHIAEIDGPCYVLGPRAIKEELDEMGITNVGHGPDPDPTSYHPDKIKEQMLYKGVEAVVVGYDKDFSYNKMVKAASYIMDPNCKFIATNYEKQLRIGKRHFLPLTGALADGIASSTGRRPTVIGKPNTLLYECLLKMHPDIDIDRTLMIGDSMKTDIPFAHNIGVDSILVLTGSSSAKELWHTKAERAKEEHCMPTYTLNAFSDLRDI